MTFSLDEIKKLVTSEMGDYDLKSMPLIIYGAGNLGKLLYELISQIGVKAELFLDEKSSVSEILGVQVLHPEDSSIPAKLKDEALCVACFAPENFGLSFNEVEDKLAGFGLKNILHFEPYRRVFCRQYLSEMPLTIAERFQYLSHASNFFEVNYKEIEATRMLFSDQESIDLYDNFLKFCLNGDKKYLEETPFSQPQYFVDGVCPFEHIKSFFDIGAYNGDTLNDVQKYCPNLRSCYSFEPELSLFKELTSREVNPGVEFFALPFGISNKVETTRFGINDYSTPQISESGSNVIVTVNLDECFKNVKVDMIKMDIEGAELSALSGCKEIIAEQTPFLAICVYHRMEDVIKFPAMINEFSKNKYRFFLRRHYMSTWMETVLYAVPERMTSTD